MFFKFDKEVRIREEIYEIKFFNHLLHLKKYPTILLWIQKSSDLAIENESFVSIPKIFSKITVTVGTNPTIIERSAFEGCKGFKNGIKSHK